MKTSQAAADKTVWREVKAIPGMWHASRELENLPVTEVRHRTQCQVGDHISLQTPPPHSSPTTATKGNLTQRSEHRGTSSELHLPAPVHVTMDTLLGWHQNHSDSASDLAAHSP